MFDLCFLSMLCCLQTCNGSNSNTTVINVDDPTMSSESTIISNNSSDSSDANNKDQSLFLKRIQSNCICNHNSINSEFYELSYGDNATIMDLTGTYSCKYDSIMREVIYTYGTKKLIWHDNGVIHTIN